MASTNLFPGNKAPDFKIYNDKNSLVSLSDYYLTNPTMIVFYPADFTWICTKQLCAYQESRKEFSKFGIQVLGVSPNSVGEHQSFKAKYGFDFDLLSDPKRSVFKTYGVTSLFSFGGVSRANFIIGKDGKVLYRYVEPTILMHRKVDALLGVFTQLRSSGKI
jgi:peroxiredoxin Q/BCP